MRSPRTTTVTATSRGRRTVLALAVVATLGACSAVAGAGEPERDEQGEITQEGEASVFAIAVGDCLDVGALDDDVDSVLAVPCDEPHGAEVYAATELPEGEYPGDDAVVAAADEFCLAEFEAFVGVDYGDSELGYLPLLPTGDSWDTLGDRAVHCIVTDATGEVTGSLQGAAR